jgi:hypothetical protein
MRRHNRDLELAVTAAQGALGEGERVVVYGQCWAVRRRRFVPLVLLPRRRVLLLLTDRRLLVFAPRRGRKLQMSDLLIGKRFETYRLDGVRRARPLLQVRLSTTNGARLALEFGPRSRALAAAVTNRLNGTSSAAGGRPWAGPGLGEDPAYWEPPPASRAVSQPPTEG